MIRDQIEKRKLFLKGKTTEFGRGIASGIFLSGEKASLMQPMLVISAGALLTYFLIRRLNDSVTDKISSDDSQKNEIAIEKTSTPDLPDTTAYIEFRDKVILIGLEVVRQLVIRLIRKLGDQNIHERV